jgi:hypothetical protein
MSEMWQESNFVVVPPVSRASRDHVPPPFVDL